MALNGYISVDRVNNGGTLNGKPSPDGRSWLSLHHVHFEGGAPWTAPPAGELLRKMVAKQAFDKTAPQIMSLTASGAHLNKVELQIANVTGGMSCVVTKITLEDVVIASAQVLNGSARPLFEVKYFYTSATIVGPTTHWLHGW